VKVNTWEFEAEAAEFCFSELWTSYELYA
jgi:hypothetical protein